MVKKHQSQTLLQFFWGITMDSNTVRLLNKNKKKMLKNVLVQGPGYTKRPFGHCIIWLEHKEKLYR